MEIYAIHQAVIVEIIARIVQQCGRLANGEKGKAAGHMVEEPGEILRAGHQLAGHADIVRR